MTAQLTDSDVLSAVTAALSTVCDPELDESIVDLGFIEHAAVRDGVAEINLRLPTYFCAPNFAYLMVADAADAVRAVPGVRSASITLLEHFAAAEINAGVSERAGFLDSFGDDSLPDEPAQELDQLRLNFQRKAHTACLERASQLLLSSGWTVPELARARIGDLPDSRERTSLLRRRRDIGLAVAQDSSLFVDDAGQPVPADELPLRLRFARTVRVSIDGNAHFCRGLLTTRYPEAAADQRPRPEGQEA